MPEKLPEALLKLKTTLDGYLAEMKKAKASAEQQYKGFKKGSKDFQSFGKEMTKLVKKLTTFILSQAKEETK